MNSLKRISLNNLQLTSSRRQHQIVRVLAPSNLIDLILVLYLYSGLVLSQIKNTNPVLFVS